MICSRIDAAALRWSGDFGVFGVVVGGVGARGAGLLTPELSGRGGCGASAWAGWQMRASASINRSSGTHI